VGPPGRGTARSPVRYPDAVDHRIERLKSLLLERAVRFGEFTLASGAKSDVYVDGRLLTLSAEGSAVVAELLWEKIEPLKLDAVGGMTMGADPIVGALVHLAGTRGSPLGGFLVRKEPKGHGTKRSVEGPRPDAERPRVALVEDTTTTGFSTLKAVDRVREEWNADVVGVFCIVDREEGAVEAYAARGLVLTPLVRLSELRSNG
jgi:orotate phosphoribosyltransferase